MYDILASHKRVAVAHLMQKIKKACKRTFCERFGVVGGASANLYLRGELELFCCVRLLIEHQVEFVRTMLLL